MAVETDVAFDPAALSVPAVYANRFQVTVVGSFVRVAFAEGMEGKNFQYRTAVVMNIADARELTQAVNATVEAHLARQNG